MSQFIEYPLLAGTHKDQVQLWLPKMTTQKTDPLSESVVQTLFEFQQLGAMHTALQSLFHAHCPVVKKIFSIPSLTLLLMFLLTIGSMQVRSYEVLFHCLWLIDDLGSGQNVSVKSTWACTVNVYVCYWYLKAFNWWNKEGGWEMQKLTNSSWGR